MTDVPGIAGRAKSRQTGGRRVVFLTGRLEPRASCRAIVGLACQLKRLGLDVEMISRSGSVDAVYPDDGSRPGADHRPTIWLSRALGRNLRSHMSLGGLVKQVRKLNPDLVHVHGAELAGVGARLARRVRKPYVLSVNDFIDPGRWVSRSRRFLRKVIASSDAVRVDLVNRLRLPRELIQVVAPGVDVRVCPSRGAGLRGFDIPVVGSIGRFVHSQGQESLLRALHLLAVRGRNVYGVVAGGGPDRKRLQNLATELDLVDRVTFARAPVDELDVLRALDIFVVPALREALGLPVIEAMACGIPVVATSAGGVFSLVENGKTGLLVGKNDPDALATRVEELLDAPDLARELAGRGRERVTQEFRIETVAEHVAAIYADVWGEQGDEPPGSAAGRAAATASRTP
jgi:glycosyltransferase involved in cell wall biosynthesis